MMDDSDEPSIREDDSRFGLRMVELDLVKDLTYGWL